MFGKKKSPQMPKNSKISQKEIEELAEFLGADAKELGKFNQSYQNFLLKEETDASKMFSVPAKQAKPEREDEQGEGGEIARRIIDELKTLTEVWEIKDGICERRPAATELALGEAVSSDEVKQLPEGQHPMCTGKYSTTDMNAPAGVFILSYYKKWKETGDTGWYKMFRQGLDILDIDPLVYAMLDQNPNSMSHWLPQFCAAVKESGCGLKIPDTVIAKIPMTLLQLTRIDYERLNQATRNIINTYCMEVFYLDISKDYFVKTGTFSSKFDFRNAHVTGAEEVRTLGEYLVYIQDQAVYAAGPLSSPSVYGMSTTTEWVVRDYIQPVQECQTIYKGLPLRTEYRVFVDFDTREVIGISPYWEEKLMEKRFSEKRDGHDVHDYVAFETEKLRLRTRYEENKEKVVQAVAEMAACCEGMTGQWSVDIMQNGSDFWLIDAAIAQQSALFDCVPGEKKKAYRENWLPEDTAALIGG